jgi:dolichol-phosphate mannosyltransferase
MEISVVTAVFNEQECIEELVKRLSSTLSALTDSYEIIIVDDGSTDTSWEIISRLQSQYSNLRALKFSRNFGHHIALTAGLDLAKGSAVIVMDSDLQDAPEDIPKLLQGLKSSDIVLARRKSRQHGMLKQVLSKTFYKCLSKLSNIEFDPEVGIFRAMNRPVVNEMCLLRERTRFFLGIAQWVGFSTSTVDVEHRQRFAGETKYPLSKQLALAMEAALSFTDKPLKLSIYLGSLFSILGIAYAFYIILLWFQGKIVVLGYASLICTILIVGGISILSIGITGLYVGRIFREVKQRPLYIIEKEL